MGQAVKHSDKIPGAAHPAGVKTGLKSWFTREGPFTREVTADVMYLMLNIGAGPQGESLGDILAAEYDMSDVLLYEKHSDKSPGAAHPAGVKTVPPHALGHTLLGGQRRSII